MKKTIHIHLNNLLYNLEEEAYNLLDKYLQLIQRKYRNTPGCEEILKDIESRIGEMFTEKLKPSIKEVVTLEDVKAVIKTLGNPDQFEQEPGSGSFDSHNTLSGKRYRKLYRNPDDAWLGGICSGFAAYFGISDPLVLRVLFIFFMIVSFGTTAIVYFILWALVPKARTASEKLEMHGEPVNVNTIGKKIEEEWEELKRKVKS